MKTLIVNFYGGPGSGKSTMCARIFAELKDLGYNVEIAHEYAKEMTWRESLSVLKDQIYVFGKQQHKLWFLDNKVQIILTDSPLLFSLVYGADQTSQVFKEHVITEYHKRPTVNIFLNRVKPYNPSGRSQTEEAAIELDKTIYDVVCEVDKFHFTANGEKASADEITKFVLQEYYKINEL